MYYQEAIEVLKRNKPTSDQRLCGKQLCTACDVAISAMQELEEYKQLGTLEEVREAVERQRAKKPLLGGNTDKLAGDIRICPNCSGVVGIDDIRADFCADCGQRIDWSGNNGKANKM